MTQPTRSLRSCGDLGRSAREPDSWWDNPGRPTPYILWGLLWCACGTTMVPLDRPAAGTGTGRFYRCDAGCGRRPIPAAGLEAEVLGLVVEAALRHFPGWRRQGWRARRLARSRARPDRHRDLIRRWLHRVTAGGGHQPQLHWQSYDSTPS